MNINGSECLVICLSHVFLGDTPALKTMCGYSPSISATCYVTRPCMVCDVKVEDLRRSIPDASLRGEVRSLQPLLHLYRCNNKLTGAPTAAWIREAMKQLGYVYFPEFLRLTDQPRPDLLSIDSMHAQLKGALLKHFILFIDILTSGDGSKSVTSHSVWRQISQEFSRYCKDNKISAFTNFASKKQFKLRMTANSMKELSRVAAEILVNLQLVKMSPVTNSATSYRTWKKHLRAYEYWCIHATVCHILEQHQIAVIELNALESLIPRLLAYFEADFPADFVTINIHYYLHMVDQVRRLGPMRIVSNHSREMLIKSLKPFYRNTNNKQTETSVFNRYRMSLFFKARCAYLKRDSFELSKHFWISEGLVSFDFFGYDHVILDAAGNRQVFTRSRYSHLSSFKTNAAGVKRVKWKRDYTVLERGHYIYMTGNNSFLQPFAAKLVAILEHDGELFLAYTVPEAVDAENNFRTLQSKPWCVSKHQPPTLYISPVNHYVARLYMYETKNCLMLITK